MATAAMKHMASSFAKLEKFEGVDFRRWQKKMHFMLSSMSVVYVPTTPMPDDGGENPTVEQVRKRAKWDNDDYVCRGLILNGMSDSLFDVYQNVETSKELWDTLEAKYMAEDASSKKFLVSNFTNYKITDSRPVLEQYNELLGILGRFTQHNMNMDESIKEELTLIELGSHLRIEESLRAQDNDKIESNKFVLSKHGHVHFKRMQDMSKDGLIPAFDMDTEKCQTCMLNKITKKPFQNVKRETKVLELIHSDLCDLHATPSLRNKKYFVTFIDDASRTDRGGEYMDTLDLYDLHATPSLRTKKYFVTFIDDASRAVVRLPDPKLKTLGERGIECIFVGYVEHSKAFRFYIIEPNDSVAINSIIESRDAIFDEHRFLSVPRPSQRSLVKGTGYSGGSVVSERVTDKIVQQSEPRKSKRHRTPKDFGPEFQLYLVEGTRDEVSDQHSYCFNVEDDPKTFDEAMKSQDVAFWKEAINDEMDSIMGNNTWVLTDLPPGCRPLGCKWIFKRKIKVDGTVERFKARLVIQGFKQKSVIDYFDTYAPVARISTIRLLIALALIHSLIIHQMDIKTAFLNGVLEEEVYMNQPLGFILPGNENKVCKLIKSLYGLKQAPKQWHQKFDEVVLSNGYLLNQADKFVYSKFDASGKGVIICLNVDDMLIFGTDQVQVDRTKEFLSSMFSMKDIGEADVIQGIRIKHESNGIAISQSHYIKKVLKKFNYSDCTPVSTPLDTCEKLMPNKGLVVSQLEYSRVIGCLMYAMTCTRPDIAFAVGKLSRLLYSGYPSVLEGYTDVSWISNTEDNSSTSGWVFLLGGGVISWAFKKQTCITGSTMEFEFVALAASGKEAEWLKNMLLEIPLWVKPMAPISIRCDSAATLEKAYSQVYNGNSRHLGVRHSMIRELITNKVIFIDFVRSQQNLDDHLTKGLARDLVIKSAKGMGLKSNQVAEC
ncbi:zinc finger, CCHC-type containing protein [Tanacetum coccineum]